MPDRSTVLADAAIEVVGAGGIRALTHRAVDAAAGLPAGSTSNVYRSREALLSGVLDRLLARESAAWFAGPTPLERPRTVAARLGAAADALVGMLDLLTTRDRTVTVARLAVLAQASLDPAMAARVSATRAEVRERTAAWLGGLGIGADVRLVPVALGTFEQCLLARFTGEARGRGWRADERRLLLAALRAVRG